jgi:hypothetical protein
VVLAAYQGIQHAIAKHGSFGAKTREAIALTVAVAREIAGSTGYVTDAAWQAALDAGWGDTELAELFAHVAVNLFTNYFNHYAQTEPDLPAPPGLEGWSPLG